MDVATAPGGLDAAAKALPSDDGPLVVGLTPHPLTVISASVSASGAVALGRVIGRVGVGRRSSSRRRGWRGVLRASVVLIRRGSLGRRSSAVSSAIPAMTIQAWALLA